MKIPRQNYLKSVLKVAKREFTMILRDSRLAATVLVAPVIYALLMGFVYGNHQVNDLPLALVQRDYSAYSRQLVRMIESSSKLRIAYRVNSEAEVESLMNQGKIDGAVLIPRDFSLRIKRGEDAFVGTFTNASSLIPANTIASGLNNVVQSFSFGVETNKLEKSGMSRDGAQKAAMPVKLSMRPMYNPGFNYSNFIVPGLFMTILQQIILMGMALSMSGERESGTLGELFKIHKNPWIIMAGKGLPYAIIGFILAEFYLRVLFPVNHIPIIGSWWLTLGMTILFILTLVTWGLWVSSFCKSRLFATQILMFIAMPSFVLSGFTWPLMAMPGPIQWISQGLPMTHFISSFRSVYLAGAGIEDVLPSVAALGGFLGVNVMLGYWGIRRLRGLDGIGVEELCLQSPL